MYSSNLGDYSNIDSSNLGDYSNIYSGNIGDYANLIMYFGGGGASGYFDKTSNTYSSNLGDYSNIYSSNLGILVVVVLLDILMKRQMFIAVI